MTTAKRGRFTMSRKLATMLIIGQIVVDLGFLVYIWSMQIWQNEVTESLVQILGQNMT